MDKLPPRKRTTSLNSDTTTTTLPPPPPLPQNQQQKKPEFNKSQSSHSIGYTGMLTSSNINTNTIQRDNLHDSIQFLRDYKTREKEFLKTLKETIANDCNLILKKENELYKSTLQSKSMSNTMTTSENLGTRTASSATNNNNNISENTSIDSSSLNRFGLSIIPPSSLSSGSSNKTSSSDEMTTTATKTATALSSTKSLKSNISHQTTPSTKSSLSSFTTTTTEQSSSQHSRDSGDLLRDECEQFIMPLLNRTNSTISAVLATYDAFEQLNSLHRLVDQMFAIEEQNYQMRKYIRDVKMLCELKKLQSKDYSNELLNETGDLYDNELDLNNHSGLLNTILAAGNSASSKRSTSKRQQRERSKSVFCDDISKENLKVTPRRQSAYTSDANKAKVSKWTKVKAAFKWEKANVQSSEEISKIDGNQLKPVNNEVARYLRVPAPVPITGSSADSILSSSIPPTPGTISSASSIDDVRQPSDERRDSSKSDSRFETQSNNADEENHRSRSLDSDLMLSQISIPTIKTKTPWNKVKNIIQTHRGSFKNSTRSRSIKSTNSAGKESRDVSPSEMIFDGFESSIIDSQQSSSNNKNNISNIISPSSSSTTANSQNTNLSGPNSPGILSAGVGLGVTGISFVGDDIELKSKTSPTKPIRKSKIISGAFESLPEGMTVDITSPSLKHINRPPPSPLNLSSKMDSSDPEFGDLSYSPTILQKINNKVLTNRKNLTSAGNSSVPSSPSRHSEFFAEFESEDMSSGDFSEPTTPSRKRSDRLYYQMQQDEINERYLELREKLNKEFEAKRQEWEKMRLSCSSSSSSAYQLLNSNDLLQSSKSIPPKLLEENLSADFKKKLHKWRNKKPENTTVIIKDPNSPPKGDKIDWHLWKTGQLKLEGQGLSPLPDQKSLPEEFQKKLEQWKKMKDSNTVPTYSSDNQNSLRRSSAKFGIGGKSHESIKKSKDDSKIDREKLRQDRDKQTKSHDKDKLEKLSKLRAIVTEPKIKEIEVQTSAGLMKFEGISRKFARKLYEWEKARGIGPESSTFAFLSPGYKSEAVGGKSKEHRSHEPSPSLGRSLSLDSISPMQSMPSISHQPSCLSLNDADEFRETENLTNRRISSNLELSQPRQFDETRQAYPKDEHIMLLGMPNAEKRAERRLYSQKSFQSDDCFMDSKLNTNNHRKNDKTIEEFGKAAEILESIGNKPVDNIRNALIVLTELEKSIPDLEMRLQNLNSSGKEAMARVRNHVSQLMVQCNELNQDEACCQELLDERTEAIEQNLQDLQKNIILVCKHAKIIPSESIIPKINVTLDEDDKIKNKSSNNNGVKKNGNSIQSQIPQNQKDDVQILSENTAALNFNTKPQNAISEYISDANRSKISRNSSNGSRKKSRLRKMGSRQNSKTESESTDDEAINNIEVTQRRLKRRLSRNKKSIDEDKSESNLNEEITLENNTAYVNSSHDNTGVVGEDVVYVLKIKPGQPIEQSEITGNQNESSSKCLISPTETSVQLMTSASQENVNYDQQNIFVKTKRKIFTLVGRQNSEIANAGGITVPVVVSRDLDSSTTTEIHETEDSYRNSTSEQNLSQSSNNKTEQSSPSVLVQKHPLESIETSKQISISPKEPCSSIRLMIAKYNEKLECDRTSRSPISSGTCTPSSIRSPVLERKMVKAHTNKYQENIEKVVKSASAGSIIPSKSLYKIEIPIDNGNMNKMSRISKSFSLENISDVKPIDGTQSSDIQPLAYDSLENLNKSSETVENIKIEVIPKEHLFKKNKEKPNSLIVSKSGALRKIDLKNKAENLWRRSSSTSDKTDFSPERYRIVPDKSDNTIPKITRKLENKATTPTEKSHPLSAELWHPLLPFSNREFLDEVERPKTPLNERAVKLARAKEEFLLEIPSRSPSFRESSDAGKSDATWNNQRFSQTSFGSEFSNENGALLKCASVGMIEASSTATLETEQDDNNFDENERYVSLPRSISRSGKITSKLGFATLASKFRKVKMKRENRDESTNKSGGALSALCRQSLLLDVTSTGKNIPDKEMPPVKVNKEDNEAVAGKGSGIVKSKSSHVGSFGTLFKSKDKNRDRRKDRNKDNNKDKDNLVKSKSAILPNSSLKDK